jgi:hypothetical protein
MKKLFAAIVALVCSGMIAYAVEIDTAAQDTINNGTAISAIIDVNCTINNEFIKNILAQRKIP